MRKLFLLLMIALAAAISGAPACAGLNIMPMEQVHAGMKGQGRTVFRGTEPQPFDVEVLGILPGGGPGGGDMVLVRVSGALIQSQGGVALGMSGSPVYIGGKLLGALSSTFAESDHSLGGVTPIRDMMQAYDYMDTPGKVRIEPPVNVDGVSYSMLDYTNTENGAHVLHPVQALAPVAIRGISERSYEFLKPYFAESGLELLPFESMSAARETGVRATGGAVDIGKGKDLKPGQSVAVQLVRGDIDISAVGTVTAIDGNKVLAFGHPFFRKGDVDYLLADAPVLAIMNGTYLSFKITSTGVLRGCIRQDRGSGVIGYLDKYPMLVPLSVTVEDMDIGRKREFHVKIVQDQDLLPNLIVAVLVNAIDNTIDRFGPGTATMDFTLKADGVDTDIERRNMFYSSYDVSASALQELMMAMSLLKENYFQEAGVSGLKVNIRLKASHDTAAIVKAELLDPETGEVLGASEEETKNGKNGKVAPGDNQESEIKDQDSVEEEDEYEEDEEDEYQEEEQPETEDAESGGRARSRVQSPIRRRSNRSSRELTRVHPGQKLALKVTIRPYKKEEIEQEIFIKVPADMSEGTAIVRIFSGVKYMSPLFGMEGTFFDFMMDDFSTPEHGLREDRDGRKKDTLNDIIKKFLERDRNNELVATITSMSAAPPDKKDKYQDEYRDQDDEDWDEFDIEAPPPDRAKKATDWVLFGSSTIRVRVVGESGDSSIKTGGIEKSKIKTLEQKGNGK